MLAVFFRMQNHRIHKTPEQLEAENQSASMKSRHKESMEGHRMLVESLQENTEGIDNVHSTLEESKGILEEIRDKEFPEIPEIPEFPTKIEVSIPGVSVITLKGDKGDQGEKGDSPLKEELLEIIKPLIPEPVKGEKGDSIIGPVGPRGEKGDSITGPSGKDGVDGKDGRNGNDGSPDSPDEVVEKVNQAKKKIDSKQIDGLPEIMKYVDQSVKFPQGKGGGGSAMPIIQANGAKLSDHVTTINFSANLTAVYSGNGVITVTGSAGSGTIDGSGTANELAYWTDADTLGTLPVATYPSLTELSYVKGVTSAIQTQLNAKAADSDVVHDSGDETIAGVKTFSSDPIIPDEAYGIGWNGSLEPATKNAIYDKIETLPGGHDAVTVTDSAEIDFTLTGQNITASLIAGSIDETKLDASVNASLDLADTALQAANISDTAYDATTWDAVTTIAPSKNAVRDKIEGLSAVYAPVLGADDNYVTDAEKTKLSNLSGTNTGDQTSVSGNAGSATVLQTTRAIYGNNFDGSAALTQVIASTYGGTGNGFAKFSGPTTAEKTFALPDASATILTSNAVVTVAQGGTGTGSIGSAGSVVYSNGTTQAASAVGTLGQVLISGGAGAPGWAAPTAGSVIFAGTGGILSQDNATFFWDNTNKRIGFGTTSPTNTISLNGNAARIIWMERHTTANTAGNTLTLQASGATVAATDKAGGGVILKPGTSTGTGESGVQVQGCVAGSTGTADNSFSTMMQVLGNKVGFYGVTPVVRPTALTTKLTDITFTAPGTPDYAMQTVQLSGYGFATADEGNTALSVIKNLQTRVSELETKLQSLGLLT